MCKLFYMKMGRPPQFDDPELMKELIDKYFDTEKQVTITGLCLFLGFVSRQSFYDYEKKPDFTYILKEARTKVELYYEKMSQRTDGQVTGPIFALKQFGWTDKTEATHTFTNRTRVTFDTDDSDE